MHREGKRQGRYCQLVVIVELFGQLVSGGVHSLPLKYNSPAAQAGETGGTHTYGEGSNANHLLYPKSAGYSVVYQVNI